MTDSLVKNIYQYQGGVITRPSNFIIPRLELHVRLCDNKGQPLLTDFVKYRLEQDVGMQINDGMLQFKTYWRALNDTSITPVWM